MSTFYFIIFAVSTSLIALSFDTKYAAIQEPWKAPASADTLVNPYYIEPLTLPQGQEIYTIYCAPCHGNQGKADGLAYDNLKVKPPKFQDKKVTAQTNGALFWKIREGRGEMPAFKELLSEEQKWQLVEYVRDLSKPYKEQMNPFKARH